MREKSQELAGELVEEWRPQASGWLNSANNSAPESQKNSPASHLAGLDGTTLV